MSRSWLGVAGLFLNGICSGGKVRAEQVPSISAKCFFSCFHASRYLCNVALGPFRPVRLSWSGDRPPWLAGLTIRGHGSRLESRSERQGQKRQGRGILGRRCLASSEECCCRRDKRNEWNDSTTEKVVDWMELELELVTALGSAGRHFVKSQTGDDHRSSRASRSGSIRRCEYVRPCRGQTYAAHPGHKGGNDTGFIRSNEDDRVTGVRHDAEQGKRTGGNRRKGRKWNRNGTASSQRAQEGNS